jgi:hypothetical protein
MTWGGGVRSVAAVVPSSNTLWREQVTFVRTSVLSAILLGVAGLSISAQTPMPKPGLVIGRADFARLRWIEGSWRGKSEDGAYFYERYRFTDDSTLLVESFVDAKFGKVSEQTRYVWRDRHFGNAGNGPRWVATAFDSQAVSFTPLSGAKNGLIWRWVDADHWTSVLTWPPTLDRPAREVVYQMERVKGK